jgi:hypothetical protein
MTTSATTADRRPDTQLDREPARGTGTIRLAIRCHTSAPVGGEELEDWLRQQLISLQERVPEAIARLTRLSQELPDSEVNAGWLLEVEVPDSSALRGGHTFEDVLADVVRDMRFIGLEPDVLVPFASQRDRAAGHVADELGHSSFPASDPPAVWTWETQR